MFACMARRHFKSCSVIVSVSYESIVVERNCSLFYYFSQIVSVWHFTFTKIVKNIDNLNYKIHFDRESVIGTIRIWNEVAFNMRFY